MIHSSSLITWQRKTLCYPLVFLLDRNLIRFHTSAILVVCIRFFCALVS